ncbi:MAG: N-formylglutamate amidohydrolase, partial [Bacteriovoracaceae bacterium]
MQNYTLVIPPKIKYPIIVSSPHSGTAFPENLKHLFEPAIVDCPKDADWHVDKIYDFVTELGIPLIYASYSRYVVDLNRSPQNESLYNDGRALTGLTPLKTFFGDEIYHNGYIPDNEDIANRLKDYFWPYYEKVEETLNTIKSQFGKALLWDAHSIKRNVPSIRKNPFPDLILGSNDGNSSPSSVIECALEALKESKYGTQYNDPFKGGHITRYFGKPEKNIYALQLEMSQDLYG